MVEVGWLVVGWWLAKIFYVGELSAARRKTGGFWLAVNVGANVGSCCTYGLGQPQSANVGPPIGRRWPNGSMLSGSVRSVPRSTVKAWPLGREAPGSPEVILGPRVFEWNPFWRMGFFPIWSPLADLVFDWKHFSLLSVFRHHFLRILSVKALKWRHLYQSYDNFGDFTCPSQPGQRATTPSVLFLRSPVRCIHSKETDDVIQNGGLVIYTN